MLAAAEILENEQDRLAWLMTLEMGKPLQQARAEAANAPRAAVTTPRTRSDSWPTSRFPMPTAAASCASNRWVWCSPSCRGIFLLAGDSVRRAHADGGKCRLLKHAGSVPQCGLALEELFLRAGFADGCFQYLAVESKTVQRVIEDPRVAAVTLTGSVEAGSAVAAIAGKKIKRTVLELGGSDPFVVMPSAPLAATVDQAVKARVQNNGQSCIAAKRFIVHAGIYDEFETFSSPRSKIFAWAIRSSPKPMSDRSPRRRRWRLWKIRCGPESNLVRAS